MDSKNHLLLFLLFFLFYSSTSIKAQHAVSASEEKIKSILNNAQIPAISLTVIGNSSIEWTVSLGQKSIDSAEKIDENTVFEAASLSKVIFAYIVLQLVEESLLDLDTPLFHYFEYEDLAHDARCDQITARMVLSHTSGLPNWRRGSSLQFQYNPNQQFRYSGEGFVFLQRTIEKITGSSLKDLAQERVFSPLDMHNSSYVWRESFEANHALPHDDTGTTRSKNKPEEGNAAHSLHTTSSDYAKFLLAIINKQGIDPSTVSQMVSEQSRIYKNSDKGEYENQVMWGLGVGLQKTNDEISYWHWGDNGSFKAFFLVNLKNKNGFVYFTNSAFGLAIAQQISNTLGIQSTPALEWIDYESISDPSLQLWLEIQKSGFTNSIAQYMNKNGLHQDTSLINERSMNSLGYRLMRTHQWEAARQVFHYNTKAYPASANVYDSYAEVLLKMGNQKSAQSYYSKAAQMDTTNRRAQDIASMLGKPLTGNLQFELEAHSSAKMVSLVGDFNDWDPIKDIFRREKGKWIYRMDLQPGIYEYKLLIDGIWILDPNNPKSKYREGAHRSILEVE